MIPLEKLMDGSITQRNFEKIARFTIDFGNSSLQARFGTASVTWPGGSDTSNTVTDAHGLGATPTFILATANDSNAGRVGIVATADATNVSLQLQTVNGATPLNTVVTAISYLVVT